MEMMGFGQTQKSFRFFLRRARPEDVKGIHEVHMRSIRELCSKDYSLDDILAWSGRPFDEAARLQALQVSMVWVVEREEVLNPEKDDIAYAYKIGAVEQGVSGFGQLLIYEAQDQEVLPVQLDQENVDPTPATKSMPRMLAHLQALYFGAEVAGLGFGRRLVEEMFEACRQAKVEEIRLESTLTSVGFYKKMGFVPSGEPTPCRINGREIPGIPMLKRFT